MEGLNDADRKLAEQDREAVSHTGDRSSDTDSSPWWLPTTPQTHEGCGHEDVNALATDKKCSAPVTVNVLLSSTKLCHDAHNLESIGVQYTQTANFIFRFLNK